jgi:hypothetical protein
VLFDGVVDVGGACRRFEFSRRAALGQQADQVGVVVVIRCWARSFGAAVRCASFHRVR